jgi:hypothetical protein
MSEHTCHARGCTMHVPPRLLMCSRHWRLVPAELKRAIWLHYRRGQEITKDPSPEYLEAMKAAIDAVAAKEGYLTTGTCEVLQKARGTFVVEPEKYARGEEGR